MHAFGVVLDSTTEVGKGAVATILVQKGTLKKGDMILVGEQTKRVRSLVDENGSTLKEAGPSVPELMVLPLSKSNHFRLLNFLLF